MPIIMGTAGHIDHGKTTLIKALSGIDCDRLKDEKKRGITIELGFAYLDLPNGQRLGIVDVPGHEKFVKNMVAGAAGIDFVLLTVAADEGIMPQTQEHLEICNLLGIKDGLVAVTKIDTVEQDLLDLALEEIQEFLAGTFLEKAPILPVSSHTGQGIEDLKISIQEIINQIQTQETTDLFRLPVDRVFTMRGHGTVITGTLISGQIRQGENVFIYPEKKKSKIRTLQVHGQTVETAYVGQRTAVNLAGLEVNEIKRGQVLARPESLFPSFVWDIELQALMSSPRPIKHRKEIHFHHGSQETLARVYLLDREQLEPGESALAQIRFSFPLAGVYGDRFVIRSFSPLITIAGGKIINPLGRKVKRFSPDLKHLENLVQENRPSIILTQLDLSGYQGVDFYRLLVMTNTSSKNLGKILQELGSKQEIYLFDKEEMRYASGKIVHQEMENLLNYIREFHRNNPVKLGIPRGMITSDWGKNMPAKLVHFIVEKCLKQNKLLAEQEVLRLPEHKISLASDQSKLKTKLLQAYQEADIQPPNLNSLIESLGANKKEVLPVLQLLTEEGQLAKIKDGLYYSQEALDKIKNMVISYLQTNENLTPPDFKTLTGLSRKYSIPLLEYLDKEKITIRIGDSRKLRRGK